MRDYYEILGVSRDSDTQEIKRAYRRLARQHHPDLNGPDPEAEEKFKEATEAYEVLSDPQKRQAYDLYGHAGVRGSSSTGAGGGFTDFQDIFDAFFGGDVFGGADIFGGGRARRARPQRGQDISIDLELDLEEAAFGVTKEVEVRLLGLCPECGGARTTNPSSVKTCPECGGSGAMRSVRSTAFGQFIQTGPCRRCRGQGELIGDPCSQCGGQGRAYRTKTVSVEVPAGIADGQRIRFAGEGAAGPEGGRPGDLFVEIHVREHPYFQRDGDDILYRQDLTMFQAALGTTVTVPTLDGEEEIEVPPGTQAGDVKVLKARGVPRLRRAGRGDQHVYFNVMVPRDLSEHQRELLRELDESLGEEHYSQKEGLFQRLRHLFAGG
ncbi:MAG: molecular chaperone DnaJ [Thermoleophilia bacterium]